MGVRLEGKVTRVNQVDPSLSLAQPAWVSFIHLHLGFISLLSKENCSWPLTCSIFFSIWGTETDKHAQGCTAAKRQSQDIKCEQSKSVHCLLLKDPRSPEASELLLLSC